MRPSSDLTHRIRDMRLHLETAEGKKLTYKSFDKFNLEVSNLANSVLRQASQMAHFGSFVLRSILELGSS